MKKIKSIMLSFVCLGALLIGNTTLVSAEGSNNVSIIDNLHTFNIDFHNDIANDYFKTNGYNKNDEIYNHIYITDEKGNKFTDFYPVKETGSLVKLYLYSTLPENQTITVHVKDFKAQNGHTKILQVDDAYFYTSKYAGLDIYKSENSNLNKVSKDNIIYNKDTISIKQAKDSDKYYIKAKTSNVYMQLEKIKKDDGTALFKVTDNIIYK